MSVFLRVKQGMEYAKGVQLLDFGTLKFIRIGLHGRNSDFTV